MPPFRHPLLPLGVLLLLWVGVLSVPPAAARGPSENDLKAAFLLNFARLVEWPAAAFDSEDAPLCIGVAGSAELRDALARIVADEEVRGREVEVRSVDRIADVGGCHMLFLSQTERERRDLVGAATGQGLLLVGESEGFARQGAVINLYRERNKLRFEINPEAAEAARLKISSRLLRLARIVEDG